MAHYNYTNNEEIFGTNKDVDVEIKNNVYNKNDNTKNNLLDEEINNPLNENVNINNNVHDIINKEINDEPNDLQIMSLTDNLNIKFYYLCCSNPPIKLDPALCVVDFALLLLYITQLIILIHVYDGLQHGAQILWIFNVISINYILLMYIILRISDGYKLSWRYYNLFTLNYFVTSIILSIFLIINMTNIQKYHKNKNIKILIKTSIYTILMTICIPSLLILIFMVIIIQNIVNIWKKK
jgi:hypothetical protein